MKEHASESRKWIVNERRIIDWPLANESLRYKIVSKIWTAAAQMLYIFQRKGLRFRFLRLSGFFLFRDDSFTRGQTLISVIFFHMVSISIRSCCQCVSELSTFDALYLLYLNAEAAYSLHHKAFLGNLIKARICSRKHWVGTGCSLNIKYCVISKILRYIQDSGLSRDFPSESVSARSNTTRCSSRTCRVKKKDFKKKHNI